MSAAHLLRDGEPESARTCIVCGNGINMAGGAMGRFMQDGQMVDAHLACADKHNLHAVDEWAESDE
jgi:hypothetical protein